MPTLPAFDENYSALLLRTGCKVQTWAARAEIWAVLVRDPAAQLADTQLSFKPVRFAPHDQLREWRNQTGLLWEATRAEVVARSTFSLYPRPLPTSLSELRTRAVERRAELFAFELLCAPFEGAPTPTREELEDHVRSYDDYLWRWDRFARAVLPARSVPTLGEGLRELLRLEQWSEEEISHLCEWHLGLRLGPVVARGPVSGWEWRRSGKFVEVAVAEEDMAFLHARIAPRWHGEDTGFPRWVLEQDRNWLHLSDTDLEQLAYAASEAADESRGDEESGLADRFQQRVEDVFEAWSLGQGAGEAERE